MTYYSRQEVSNLLRGGGTVNVAITGGSDRKSGYRVIEKTSLDTQPQVAVFLTRVGGRLLGSGKIRVQKSLRKKGEDATHVVILADGASTPSKSKYSATAGYCHLMEFLYGVYQAISGSYKPDQFKQILLDEVRVAKTAKGRSNSYAITETEDVLEGVQSYVAPMKTSVHAPPPRTGGSLALPPSLPSSSSSSSSSSARLGTRKIAPPARTTRSSAVAPPSRRSQLASTTPQAPTRTARATSSRSKHSQLRFAPSQSQFTEEQVFEAEEPASEYPEEMPQDELQLEQDEQYEQETKEEDLPQEQDEEHDIAEDQGEDQQHGDEEYDPVQSYTQEEAPQEEEENPEDVVQEEYEAEETSFAPAPRPGGRGRTSASSSSSRRGAASRRATGTTLTRRTEQAELDIHQRAAKILARKIAEKEKRKEIRSANAQAKKETYRQRHNGREPPKPKGHLPKGKRAPRV